MASPPTQPSGAMRGETGPPGALDPAQESLSRAVRASFNVLRVLMIVLIVLYLFSGVFRVEPDQQGLVARFGALRTQQVDGRSTPVFGPGWYWALPDPFDRKYTVTSNVLVYKNTHFMFPHEQAETAKNLAEILKPMNDLQPGQHGAMLTGDKNLSHGRWEVRYRITDAAAFVQNVGPSPESLDALLGRLLESAVVREVAGRTIEEVIREAIDAVRNAVQARLQASLDRLNTGVTVVEVVAYTIEPGAVRSAFLDVTRALSERQTTRDKAEERATEILNNAAGDRRTCRELLSLIDAYGAAQMRGADDAELDLLRARIDARLDEAKEAGAGQVAVKLREAQAKASEESERVHREYEQFQKYVELRKVQPRIAVLGLWVQMREEILSNRENEVFFVPVRNEIEIHVNRDPRRQIELEEERALKRQRGEYEPGQQ